MQCERTAKEIIGWLSEESFAMNPHNSEDGTRFAMNPQNSEADTNFAMDSHIARVFVVDERGDAPTPKLSQKVVDCSLPNHLDVFFLECGMERYQCISQTQN